MTIDCKNQVSIGNVVRNAVVFNFRKQRENKVSGDNLLESVDRLFRLLDERAVDYLLVGGIALLQYVEGRNTEDIDLIMALSSLEDVPKIVIISRDKDFVRGRFDELQVDVLLTDNPLLALVQQQYATTQQFVERALQCATVEGLIFLKMYALPSLYRQGNFARVGLYENDIATLLYAYRPNLEALFDELAKHLSAGDLRTVRELIAETEQRIQRFGKEFE